jgi:anti-sigma factor RsiW
MTERLSLSDEERDDLVAYLDGELDEEAARAMEAKLSLDPRLRAEADALKTAWDLLEYLPRSEPSPGFTHRTLERLSSVRATQRAGAGSWNPWAVAAAWAAGVLIAAFIGFGGMSALLSKQPTDEDLVRDLRILENKRLYESVDDIRFLQKLADPELFGEDSVDVHGG